MLVVDQHTKVAEHPLNGRNVEMFLVRSEGSRKIQRRTNVALRQKLSIVNCRSCFVEIIEYHVLLSLRLGVAEVSGGILRVDLKNQGRSEFVERGVISALQFVCEKRCSCVPVKRGE